MASSWEYVVKDGGVVMETIQDRMTTRINKIRWRSRQDQLLSGSGCIRIDHNAGSRDWLGHSPDARGFIAGHSMSLQWEETSLTQSRY
jgi:hypothetical protein